MVSRVLNPASSLPVAPRQRSRGRFDAPGTLPYPCALRRKPLLRWTAYSPDHSRRNLAGLVSYYALFKGMAASKPTSQLSERIHILSFSTESVLGDLSRRSGFLPSRSRTLSHGSCLPGYICQAFGVCLGSVGREPPSPMQCSTSCRHYPEAIPKYVSERTSYLPV